MSPAVVSKLVKRKQETKASIFPEYAPAVDLIHSTVSDSSLPLRPNMFPKIFDQPALPYSLQKHPAGF